MKKMGLHVGLALLLSVSAVLAPPAVVAAGADQVSKVLGSANEAFRKDYERARREITAKVAPVLYCNGEVLTLVTSSDRKAENMVPERYTLLKSVDHIALAAYVILTNHVDVTLTPDVLQNLQDLEKQAAEARSALASAELDATLRERQYRIIDATIDFIARVQRQGSISHEELKQFASGLSETLMRNADDGVAAQLALMGEIVSRWKGEMTEDEWRRLHVVLTC